MNFFFSAFHYSIFLYRRYVWKNILLSFILKTYYCLVIVFSSLCNMSWRYFIILPLNGRVIKWECMKNAIYMYKTALFLFNSVQLESKGILKYYNFLCPGIDNQTFGTVVESEENWTQRAKTEWETSWQGKILVNNVVVFFEFLQNALSGKKIEKKWFWKGGGNYTEIWRGKSFKFFKNVHVGCNMSWDWVQWGDTLLKVLVWGWQHWGNRGNNSLFI